MIDKIKLFRIATIWTGKGVGYFAEKHDCSVQNIYQVVKGTTRSAHIEADIDQFIDNTFTQMNLTLNTWKKAA